MPPLPADSIHARACKLKCEKILTRPYETAEMLWNIFANNFDQLQFTELNTTTEYRKTDR